MGAVFASAVNLLARVAVYFRCTEQRNITGAPMFDEFINSPLVWLQALAITLHQMSLQLETATAKGGAAVGLGIAYQEAALGAIWFGVLCCLAAGAAIAAVALCFDRD
jgi:hypothetical protein